VADVGSIIVCHIGHQLQSLYCHAEGYYSLVMLLILAVANMPFKMPTLSCDNGLILQLGLYM
jgi:hypothetical protein